MTLVTSAARGASFTLGAQWIKFAIQLGSLAILSRILLPSDYGLVTMIMAITGIAYVITDFGFSMASVQSDEVTEFQKTNLFWLNSAIGIFLAILLVASGPLIAEFYGQPEITAIVYPLSLAFVVSCLSSQFRAESMKKLLFIPLAKVEITAQFFSFGLSIAAALSGFGFWSLILQQVVNVVVIFIGLAIITPWRPGIPRRKQNMGFLLRFGANNLGLQLVNYASNNSDSIAIGKFLGTDAVGMYGRAYQIFMMPMQQLAAPLTRVAFPVLSKLNGTRQYWTYVAVAQNGLTYLICGSFVVAGLSSYPLVEIVLGPGWENVPAILVVLSVGGIFQGLGYVYYWVFLSKAMTGIQLKYGVWSRMIMIALVLVGVRFGVIGAAAGMTLGFIVHWAVLTTFAIPKTGAKRVFFLRASMKPMVLWIIVATGCLPISFLDMANPWLHLGAILGSVILIITGTFLLCKPIRLDAIALFRLGSKFRKK